MRTTKWLIIFSFFYMFVSSLDIITTYTLVRGAGFYETNPLVSFLIYYPFAHALVETLVFGFLLLDVMVLSSAFKLMNKTDYSPLIILIATIPRLFAVLNNLPMFITILSFVLK